MIRIDCVATIKKACPYFGYCERHKPSSLKHDTDDNPSGIYLLKCRHSEENGKTGINFLGANNNQPIVEVTCPGCSSHNGFTTIQSAVTHSLTIPR